jgi:hypothetical protein
LPRQAFNAGSFTIGFTWFDTMNIDLNDPNNAELTEDDRELPASEKFEPGKNYRVELVLSPNPGFEFSSPQADAEKFKDLGYSSGGKIIAWGPWKDTKVKVVILFDPTAKIKIDLVDLLGIPAPAGGEYPVQGLEVKTDAGYMAGTISWTKDGESFSEQFINGNTYKARVTLIADGIHDFSALTPGGILHKGERAAIEREDAESVTVTITFFETGKSVISYLDLRGIRPAAGEAASGVTLPSSDAYTAGIDWLESEDGIGFNDFNNGTFALGNTYKARVTVESKEGYGWGALNKDRVIHDGKGLTVDAGTKEGTYTVTIDFGKLEYVLITALDLKGIARPQAGAKPQGELNAADLPFTAGKIVWTPDDAGFEYGRDYQAELELELRTGYSFQGLEAAGILHNGVKAEMKPESPALDTTKITVTITFNPYAGSEPDSDDDGFSDSWEAKYEFNPNDATDGGPVYVTAMGDDETGNGTDTKPSTTLAKAVWKASAALDEERRTVVVVGKLSEESGNGDAENIFRITDTGTEGITIRGWDTNAELTKTTDNIANVANRRRILYLGPGTKVTLKNITITKGYGYRGSGILLNGGDLTLGEGCIVTGNTQSGVGTGTNGAGIYAQSASLTLLPGCEVSANTLEDRNGLGAGIYGTATTVTMKGGTIADNVWAYKGNYTGNHEPNGGAGIHLTARSAFTMKDGEIRNNRGFQGGGVLVGNYSSFTMEGGSIIGNKAHHTGGGVFVSTYSHCTIKGGYITENEAIHAIAGGLELSSSSTGVMEDGFITKNTSCYDGGGLRLTHYSSFTMKGGEITGNTAKRSGGGGVSELLSSFRMEGGIIARNTAVNTGTVKGGGVLAKTFTMTGGTIYGADGGDDANSDGGNGAAAVFLYSTDRTYIGGEIFYEPTTSINDTITSYTPPQ